MPVATGPILGDLTLYTDTDNPLDFPIIDENGDRIATLPGWTANLEIDADFEHSAVKLTVAGAVVTDPEDATKDVIRVIITDDLLQAGVNAGQWPVTNRPKVYPYSLKRTNAGSEKELRVGKVDVRRARV